MWLGGVAVGRRIRDREVASSIPGCSVLTYLSSEIRDDDELLEDVLGQDVRVASFFDVVRRHVDVIGTEVEIGGRDSTDSPLRLRCERL